MRLRLITVTAVILGVFFVIALVATPAEGGRFRLAGTVTRVVDGDTLDVRLASGKRERVRLIGIDAPELNPSECLGREAASRARRLAQGRRVRLIGDPTQQTRDRYRRLLAYVELPGGDDLGRRLITEGLAVIYVYRRPFRRLAVYRTAEGRAEAEGRGIWGGCTQPPPPPPVAPPPPPPGGNCHASYSTVCIPPPPPDLDCGQISHRNFTVRWDVPDPDPHRFDGDRDGVGCET